MAPSENEPIALTFMARARRPINTAWSRRFILLEAALCGLVVAVITDAYYASAMERLRTIFWQRCTQNAGTVAASCETRFRELFESLVSISRLPSIRSVADESVGLDEGTKSFVNEVFANLSTSLHVTEICLVTDRTDPSEAGPAKSTAFTPVAGGEAIEPGPLQTDTPLALERAIMRYHLGWLREHAARETALHSLEYPGLFGRYWADDRPRVETGSESGGSRLVYAVPFYGSDSRLRGCVSAVVPTDALKELLPSGIYALRCSRHGLAAFADRAGPAAHSTSWVYRDQPDPNRVWSEVRPLHVRDAQGMWILWSGVSDAEFWSRSDVREVRSLAMVGYGGAAALAVGVWIVGTLRLRNHLLMQSRTAELERRVRERTAELEAARESAQAASKTKSDFLANMSHEIRTPMTAIIGYADLLLDPKQSPSDRVDAVQTIRRNGAHLLSLVDDILDLSKIEAGRMTIESIECSPTQIAEEVVSLLQANALGKGIGLRTRYAFPLPKNIRSDPKRVKQILVNLAGNAVKFTHKGEVAISLSAERNDQGNVNLRFDVGDSGIGMTSEQMSRLFRPFVQADNSMSRRYGGTGLGLAISHRLAGMLGGAVRATSTPGVGSVFTLEVDAGPESAIAWTTTAQSPAAPVPENKGDVSLAGTRILLAEDGPDNQALLCFHLRKAGAVVDVAENGRLAADRALAALRSGTPYDVVLMDMQMPVLDGYAATSLLRQKGYTGPIVALTAHAMAGDREKCMASGCSDYLTKPIERATLLDACARWIGGADSKARAA